MLTDDMARNPMALVQAVARPAVPGIAHPTVDGMSPGDPGYQRKIPPPEPMSKVEAALIEEEKRRQEAHAPEVRSPSGTVLPGPGVASPSTFRLLVTSCREEDTLIVGLERAPDWDVTETWTMSVDAANQVARVMRAVGVRIKDMSGGFLGVPDVRVPVVQEQEVPGPDPSGPRDGARDVPDVRGAGTDHARESLGGPDPGGAPGIRAVDAGSNRDREFLEEARRQYEEELERGRQSASPPTPTEETPNGGEDPRVTPSDRENALRRRLGLPESPAVPGGIRGSAGDPDRPPDGPNLLAPGEAPAQPE